MPRGRSLYGSLPEQLADETSFARQLQAILAVRKRHGVAVSRQVDVPDVSHKGMLVMVHQLADPAELQLTVLNFADETDRRHGPLASGWSPGATLTDSFSGEPLGVVDDLSSFIVELRPHGGCRCWPGRPIPSRGRPTGTEPRGRPPLIARRAPRCRAPRACPGRDR